MQLFIPFFDRLSIGARLFILAAFAFAAIAAAALLFAVADQRMEQALEEHAAASRVSQYTHEIEIGLASLRTRQHAFMISGDPATAQAYTQASARLRAVLKALGDIPLAAEVRTHVDTLRDGVAEHAEAFRKLTASDNEKQPTRGAVLTGRIEAALESLETLLAGPPGLESQAATVLALRSFERRYLSGETEALAELVRHRQAEFDTQLLSAPLNENEKARIAGAMDAYVAALAESGRWMAEEKRISARLDDILDYVQPNLEAITALRREATAILGETEERRETTRTVMLAGSAGVLALFLLLATFITLSISRPIRSLAESARDLATGNREAFVPVTTATNEIGELARGLRAARDALAEAHTRSRARDNRERSRELHAEATRRMLANEIETEVLNATDALARASTELRGLAESVAEAAQETGRRAQDVTAASRETTGNLRDLAAVASSLHSSVAEIHRRIAELDPNRPDGEVDAAKLAKVAGELRGYLERVANIALRTRLMALKGAVASAGPGNEEITAEIGELADRVANDGIGFSDRIKAAVAPLSDVAASIEMQGTAVREILRNAEGAVSGSLQTANAVSRIGRAAEETGRAAGELKGVADEAAQHAERLRRDVETILTRVRTLADV